MFNPKILYEDDFLLAIEKPAGVVVNNANSVVNTETVQDWAEEHIFLGTDTNAGKSKDNLFFERKGIVHRLDKDTSGVLLLAKNEAVFALLQAKFKSREIKKTYLALVHGDVPKDGQIKSSIMRHPSKGKFIVDEKGKESFTEYKLIDRYIFNDGVLNDFEKKNYERLKEKYEMDKYSFVEVRIHTGRTHQIRVHFSFIKHPVVGDALYGFRKMVNFEKMWMPRQFLHAAKLIFDHPVTNKKMTLESKLPENLVRILSKYMKQV